MKESIITLAVCTFMAFSMLVNCNSRAEKVKHEQREEAEEKSDLANANQEYLANIENHRKQTSERIATNNQIIADFKVRVNNEKKDAKTDYLKKIAKIEGKNSDMKKRMNGYKANSKDNWETFKSDFDRDMDDLGWDFKGLPVRKLK